MYNITCNGREQTVSTYFEFLKFVQTAGKIGDINCIL